MDLITLLTRYPLVVLAIAAALYLVLHMTVIRGLAGGEPRRAGRPSRWVIRPSGASQGEVDLTAYDLVLDAPGEERIALLRVVREATGLGLKEAKELIEGAPAVLRQYAGREQAEAVAEQLRREGARVTVAQAGATRVGSQQAFEVLLEDAGDRPIDTIRLVRELSGAGLKEAKELVEAAPRRAMTVATRQEAERLRERLEAQGAAVHLEA